VICKTAEARDAAIGKWIRYKADSLGMFNLELAKYASGGPTVYVNDRMPGPVTWEWLALHISRVPNVQQRGLQFWMGYHEVRGVRGLNTIVVFSESPELTDFMLLPGGGNGGPTARVSFRAGRLTGGCETCGKAKAGHSTVACPQLQRCIPVPCGDLGSTTWLGNGPGRAGETDM